MNDRDTDTFERFARRLARIEAEVKDPPPFGTAPRATRPVLRPNRTAVARVVAVLVMVVLLVGIAPLIGGRPTNPATSSVPAGIGAASAMPSSAPGSSLPTADALVALDPVSPPEELPGPCLGHDTIYDRARTTVEEDVANSTAVVIGTITGIGGGQWNTPGGNAPNVDHLSGWSVIRFLRVGVDTVVNGKAPGTVTLWVPGGQIGCQMFSVGGFAGIEVGSRDVFFLRNARPRSNVTGVDQAWQVWSMDGDRVATAFEGHLPVAALIERARSTSAP
jgi:hypothetical protein